MRSSASRRWLAVALGLAVSLGAGAPLFAQDDAAPPAWVQTLQMPEGWEAAGWEQFTADFMTLTNHLNRTDGRQDPAFDAGHMAAVEDRAWVFLQDEKVIAEGDLTLIRHLVIRVGQSWKRYDDGRGERMQELYLARLEQEDLAATKSFTELLSVLGPIRRARFDQAAERVAGFKAAWVEANGASALMLKQRLDLLVELDQPAVDIDRFSARFIGRITLPKDGLYVWNRQGVGPSASDWVRVTIGDRVVLDTGIDEAGQPNVAGPVELQAGTLPITVEFSRDDQAGSVTNRPELVLVWRRPGEDVLPYEGGGVPIPASVFSTEAGEPGLSGVYYGEPLFGGEPVMSRVVPSIQYERGDLCPLYPKAVAAVKASLLDPAGVDAWAGLAGRVDGNRWNFFKPLACFSIDERQTLLSALLTEQPGLFADVNPKFLSAGLASASKIPDDTAVDLVRAWSEARPRFVTQPAHFDRAVEGSYVQVNEKQIPWGWMLSDMVTERWPLVEQIRDTCLIEADGGCDIEVLKLLAICYEQSEQHSVDDLADYIRALLDEAIQDGHGDAAATWHVALSVCAAYSRSATDPRILVDTRSLELAFAAAETEAVRFWALGEHAARLASVGHVSRLESLLQAAGESFTEESQVAAMQGWRDRAAEIAGTYQRMQDEQAMDRQRALLESLEGRLARAESAENTSSTSRYRRLIEQAEQQLDGLQKAYNAKWLSD